MSQKKSLYPFMKHLSIHQQVLSSSDNSEVEDEAESSSDSDDDGKMLVKLPPPPKAKVVTLQTIEISQDLGEPKKEKEKEKEKEETQESEEEGEKEEEEEEDEEGKKKKEGVVNSAFTQSMIQDSRLQIHVNVERKKENDNTEKKNEEVEREPILSHTGLMLSSHRPLTLSNLEKAPEETEPKTKKKEVVEFENIFHSFLDYSFPILVLWCQLDPFLHQDPWNTFQIFSSLFRVFKDKTINCISNTSVESLKKLIPTHKDKDCFESQKRALLSLNSICKLIARQLALLQSKKNDKEKEEEALTLSFYWMYLWFQEIQKLNPELFGQNEKHAQLWEQVVHPFFVKKKYCFFLSFSNVFELVCTKYLAQFSLF